MRLYFGLQPVRACPLAFGSLAELELYMEREQLSSLLDLSHALNIGLTQIVQDFRWNGF